MIFRQAGSQFGGPEMRGPRSSSKRSDTVGEVGGYAARALKREVCAEASSLCSKQAAR